MNFGIDVLQPRAQAIILRGAAAGLLGLLLGCSEPNSAPNVGSNSNWLTACEIGADCRASLGCNCGACSKGCSSNQDCADFAGTTCVLASEDAANALCHGATSWTSQGICLPSCQPGSCEATQACVLSACVPMALPDSGFCASVAGVSSDQRTQEEELILSVERARQTGSIDCGSGAVTGQLHLVRLDPRLTCAARALAFDMAVSGNRGLTDSAGRTTTDRYALAGYSPRFWAEGYASNASSASLALQAMLSDQDFCTGFVNTTLTDVGVGFSNNLYVATLATEQ
jgi:hypothetical protein